MAQRKAVAVRISPRGERALEEIGAEMAIEAGADREAPFYRAGEVNIAEIVRRLLAKSDPRLADI